MWGTNLHEVRKFGKAQGTVTIRIHTANNCKKFMLSSEVANASQESSEIVGVNFSSMRPINRSEGRCYGVIVANFKIMTKHILPPCELKLACNHGIKALFNVDWESIETANADVCSVQGDVAEDIVLAR